jgi:hypothetical protein
MLALLATAARADTFDVTFTPQEIWIDGVPDCGPGIGPCRASFLGGAIFTTDGICTVCSISQRVEVDPSGDLVLGPLEESGMTGFRTPADGAILYLGLGGGQNVLGSAAYDRSTGDLSFGFQLISSDDSISGGTFGNSSSYLYMADGTWREVGTLQKPRSRTRTLRPAAPSHGCDRTRRPPLGTGPSREAKLKCVHFS